MLIIALHVKGNQNIERHLQVLLQPLQILQEFLLQKTYLFRVGNGAIEFVGVSDKKDIDFQNDKLRNQRNATSQSLAKEDILNILKGGEKTSREIEEILGAVGYSPSVIDRAKTELRKEKLIDFRKDGSNREGNKQDTIYFLL